MQGEKDWEKYEIARKLKSCVDSIRNQYLKDLKSREMGTRQRAVALYFIDKVWFEELSRVFLQYLEHFYLFPDNCQRLVES